MQRNERNENNVNEDKMLHLKITHAFFMCSLKANYISQSLINQRNVEQSPYVADARTLIHLLILILCVICHKLVL